MPLVLSGSNGISTNGTNWALQFDSTGKITAPVYIRTPATPMCFVSSNGFTATGTGQVISFTSVRVNVSGSWSTTLNRFTCPVAGTYLVNLYFLVTSGTNDGDHRIHKNGSIVCGGYGASGYSGYKQAISNALIDCQVGDYIDIRSIGATSVHSDAVHNGLIIRLVA